MICEGCGEDRAKVRYLCAEPYFYECVVCVLKRFNEREGNFEMFKNPNLLSGYKLEMSRVCNGEDGTSNGTHTALDI